MPTPVAGTAAVKFVGDFSGLNREIAKHANPLASSFGNSFGKALEPVMAQQKKHIERAWTGIKFGAIAGAAGAAYALKDIVDAGSEFEKQLSSNAAVADASGKQLKKLEGQALKYGKATFFSATQAAEAQGELIKGGQNVKEVLAGGLPAALALAEAGELELALAGETLAGSMSTFGIKGTESIKVADGLATAANKTTGEVSDFAEAMKQGGGAVEAAGGNFNEALTILEAMAKALNVKGSDAGTSMKTALVQLAHPIGQAKDLTKELNAQFFNQNGEIKTATGLSKELTRILDDKNGKERLAITQTLAGTDGFRALLSLYKLGPAKIRAWEQANLKSGTAQETAAKKMDNFAGHWEAFKGSLETTEIQIYQGMTPALNTLAAEGERAANRVGDIFSNDNLSTSEKLQKSAEFLGHELGKLWDEADIPEHAAEAFAAAAPVIAEAAADAAVLAAKEFGKAFIHAPFIAKVAMGAWLINFIGGKQAFVGIAKLYGRQFGLGFTREAEASMAASAPAVIAESKAIAEASAQAAMSVPAAMPVATRSSFIGPGTGAARKAAVEAAAINDAAQYTSYLGIPDLSKELAVEGKAGSRAFIKNFASDIKAGAPAVASSIASMGGRLLQGAATWGIGGYVTGQMVKELGDSHTATAIGDALQGAGIGAAIGSVIPGVGTALGAAAGGAGGSLFGLFSIDSHEAQERGEEYGEAFLKGWLKDAPRRERLAQQGFLGTAVGKKRIPGAEPQKGGPTYGGYFNPESTGYAYRSGSGLRGERSKLEDRLQNTKLNKGQKSAIEAEIQAIDKAIRSIKKDRVDFKVTMAAMSGDALSGIGQINKDLTSGLSKADSAWGHGTKAWRQHSVEAMKGAVAAIKEGMEAGVIDTDAGQKRINALLRKIQLTSGKDPAGIAEGVAKSFKEAGQITSAGTKGLIRDLDQMPKGARKKGIEAIEQMTGAWAAGHPKLEKQVRLLTHNMVSNFGTANQKLEQSTGTAMSKIAGEVQGGATNVGGALSNIFDNLAGALEAVGSSKIPRFSATVLSTASQYHHAREATERGYQRGGPIPGTFTVPGSGSGDKVPMMLPPGSFIENREAARLPFQTGGLTPVVLEPKERVWLPPAVNAVGAANLHARNAAFPRFQKGGETGSAGSLPHPILSGPEPLRGGAQKGIDRTWKAAEKYLAAHSEPKRVLAMLRFAEAQASKGFPYVFGGGHGSFSGPYDCSGFVSAILHAGGFLDAPMSVQQGSGLYTLGAAGPGKYFTWGVRGTSGANAHTMISVKKPAGKGWGFFEAGGSGGGAHEDSGWDGAFQFRHMPGFQKGGQIGLHGPPLFRGEGPPFYDAALKHNQPWATHQAPWSTHLNRSEEAAFLRWGKNIDGKGHGFAWFGFDPRRPKNDYDMRGFWKATGGVGPAANGHFTDTWKTPYDTTFSNESIYAKRGTPFVWTPNYKWLYDRRTGQEIVSGRFQKGGEVPKKAKEAISRYGQEAFNPKSKHFVGWGYQRGGQVSIVHPDWEGKLDKRAKGLWGRARGLYPGSGSMPPLFIAKGLFGQMDDFGFANKGGVELALGPARALLGGSAYSKETMLHEWTHVHQKALSLLPTWEREGGATLFAKYAAEKLGIPFSWPNHGYRGYAERVLKTKGMPWVKRGQFGFQKGGLVKSPQRFATGGWVKVGATIDPEYGNRAYSNHGGMSFAELLQAGANRNLKGQSLTATLGIGPPHYTAEGQDYGMAMGTPIHVKMPGASKQFVMYKNDVGSGQAGDAHYKVDLHQPIATALGWSGNADIEVSTSGKQENAKEEKEHTYKEEVPGEYRGLPAKNSVHFPSTPKNLDGVNREIDHWQKVVGRYKAAIKSAKKDNRPGLAQDLQHNLADVQNHLRELRNAARALRVKKAQAHFSKLLKRKFGKLTGYETAIEQAQQAYEKRGQFAEQVVDLEPIQPELPSEPEFPEQAKGESDAVYEKKRRDAHNSFEVKREEAEKAYVASFNAYVEGQEAPAYKAVLESENDWRTKILEGEQFAAGDWQKSNALGGFEGRFEDNIVTNVENQLTLKAAAQTLTDEIKAWKQKVAEWRNDPSNDGKQEPKWIKRLEEDWEDAERKRDKILHEKLPIARSKEAGLRETLGKARELFYPGKAGGGRNGAEQYFELRSNPPTPAVGSGTFEEQLREVQGIHWTDQHEILKALPANRVAGAFGGAIWDTQAAIEELGLKINQANGSIQAASEEGPGNGGGADDSSKSELTELEKEELLHYHQRDAIKAALEPVISQFNQSYPVMPPYAGKAHTGAIVPGPPNAEKTMIVKGREGIFTEEQMAAMAPVGAVARPSGPPIAIEQLNLHHDGTATALYEGREFVVAVEDVVHKTSRPLSGGGGAGRAWRP